MSARQVEVAGSSWSAYQRMRARLTSRISRELVQATGLSDADYDILMAIGESESGSVRALALRCGLDWEKSRLSHQLRRMEERGLVAREDCAEDSRGSVVRITPEGRVVAATAREVREASIRQHFTDALTPEQLEQLEAIAVAVLARLEEETSTELGATGHAPGTVRDAIRNAMVSDSVELLGSGVAAHVYAELDERDASPALIDLGREGPDAGSPFAGRDRGWGE